mmetsp:Transcript_9491/g.15977  ORF Transcript_9491/g.15977 Transcript_9491/m.15977 type:complete len:92 (+) Transcript_9491:920-1195(+)
MDVYREVVFDEINHELLNQVRKAEGDTIVLLMRKERLKSFEKLWKDSHPDFYLSQQNKEISQKVLQKLKDGSTSEGDPEVQTPVPTLSTQA